MNALKIKKDLINQKKSNFKRNIYYFIQISFSYNSNKIEGNRLTEEQTEAIFDTRSFIPKSDDLIKLDDLIEIKNHFKLFDYMIDNIDNAITKEMILTMHKILKRGTNNEDNPLYNVGGFKTIPNIIGIQNVIHTSNPEEVETDLDKLLNDYKKQDNVSLQDIIDFHVFFERIHPLSDGNGRVGRMLMFKECLKEYNKDKKYLKDTILHFQDIYDNVCDQLLNYEIKNDGKE